jgi:hypothetical protein
VSLTGAAFLPVKSDNLTDWKNKMQAAMSHVMPAERLASQHSKEAAPGTAKH